MDFDTHTHTTQKQTNFLDVLQSRQAFWLGFATAILSMGTLGFVILGGCALRGTCSVEGIATAAGQNAKTDKIAAAPANTAPVPTDAANAAPVAATGVPVVTDTDHIRGDKNAPITIIEYSDYECPYCQHFHPTMQQVIEKYPGQVRWIMRDFPLSSHANSNAAANAAECAGEQGKYWEYGDKLFDNRDKLGNDLYAQLAKDLSLNTTDFQTCLDTNKYANAITAEAQAGAGAGISGTPGSFIIDQQGNATPIKGALPFETVVSAIDKILGK